MKQTLIRIDMTLAIHHEDNETFSRENILKLLNAQLYENPDWFGPIIDEHIIAIETTNLNNNE
jgi:hypothetical protein